MKSPHRLDVLPGMTRSEKAKGICRCGWSCEARTVAEVQERYRAHRAASRT